MRIPLTSTFISLATISLLAISCKNDPVDTGDSTAVSASITPTLATAASITSCAASSGLSKVVCLAEAFKATLSFSQLTSLQLDYSVANAKKMV